LTERVARSVAHVNQFSTKASTSSAATKRVDNSSWLRR
jgi:hypothetical protein